MRALLCLLLISLSGFTACKPSRSKTNPAAVAPQATPENLNQWSGRVDFTDNKWQIKSLP